MVKVKGDGEEEKSVLAPSKRHSTSLSVAKSIANTKTESEELNSARLSKSIANPKTESEERKSSLL